MLDSAAERRLASSWVVLHSGCSEPAGDLDRDCAAKPRSGWDCGCHRAPRRDACFVQLLEGGQFNPGAVYRPACECVRALTRAYGETLQGSYFSVCKFCVHELGPIALPFNISGYTHLLSFPI